MPPQRQYTVPLCKVEFQQKYVCRAEKNKKQSPVQVGLELGVRPESLAVLDEQK